MNDPNLLRHLRIALALVLGVIIVGTAGYMLIEQFSFVDALYTTIGMISTVGHVVHPLSEAGKLFSVAIIILGLGSLLYTLGVVIPRVAQRAASKRAA